METATSPMMEDLQEVLVSEEQIKARVQELAAEITDVYTPLGDLTIVSIINGAIPFTADLMRHITLPIRLDCMRVSSYKDGTTSNRNPEVLDTMRLSLKGRHVLLVDDILDTGHTFEKVVKIIKRTNPASLRLCALVEKVGRREIELEPDFVGFPIPDVFVVGYGLDFAEGYRNLPCIGVLKPECQNPPEWT